MISSIFYNFCVPIALGIIDIVTSILFGWWYGKSKQIPPITNPILLESATSLAAKIRSGQLKSFDVVQAYISRIKEVQPVINAVVEERFKEALEEARQVDARVQQESKDELARNQPFLGVPFTAKEAIAIKGFPFTAGLVSIKGTRAVEDATVVALMRKAGAIPLAVTNVPELLMWFESSNNIYGRTRNPYHTSRVPGGSTGGESALIASAGSIVGLGTDIMGSIRVPCFSCGIFGHKPSTCIVDNTGETPPTPGTTGRFNSTGPMCRYSVDLLPLMKVLSGENRRKLHLDTPVDVRKLRVYYIEDDGGCPFSSPVEGDIKKAMKKVVSRLEENYGIKPQKISFKELASSLMIWTSKAVTEGEPSAFAKLMAGKQMDISLLLEFVKWLFGCSEHTIHAIFFAFLESIAPKKNSKKCKEYLEMGDRLQQKLSQTLGDSGVLLYPTQPIAAPYFNQTMHRVHNYGYTAIFSVLGLPVTHCPLGLNRKGLPIGVQIVGNTNNDHLTMALATQLEKEFGGWVSPCRAL